jgi:hypothetical protein
MFKGLHTIVLQVIGILPETIRDYTRNSCGFNNRKGKIGAQDFIVPIVQTVRIAPENISQFTAKFAKKRYIYLSSLSKQAIFTLIFSL